LPLGSHLKCLTAPWAASASWAVPAALGTYGPAPRATSAFSPRPLIPPYLPSLPSCENGKASSPAALSGYNDSVEHRQSFVPERGVVGDARHMVAAALADEGFGGEACFVATVLTSELVTNAVIHAGGAFELVVTVDDDRARVAVEDSDGRLPQLGRAPPDATTGRGLKLVDAMASAWGAERSTTGKVVWFDLAGRR